MKQKYLARLSLWNIFPLKSLTCRVPGYKQELYKSSRNFTDIDVLTPEQKIASSLFHWGRTSTWELDVEVPPFREGPVYWVLLIPSQECFCHRQSASWAPLPWLEEQKGLQQLSKSLVVMDARQEPPLPFVRSRAFLCLSGTGGSCG